MAQINEITLSPDQQEVFDRVLTWLNDSNSTRSQYITIGGFAGTGKTTLIACLCNERDDLSIHACALTGKASMHLRTKLTKTSISTIHKLLYRPKLDENKSLTGWETIPPEVVQRKYGLIIVDESSMVTEKIFIDLLNIGLSIIFVGDHGQLPPIVKKDDKVSDPRVVPHRDGYGAFNLMQAPQMKLENIHRQALESPIIQLSIKARQGQFIKPGMYSDTVMKIPSVRTIEHLLKDTGDQVILTDTNKKRVKLNRMSLQFKKQNPNQPEAGSMIVFLKNNVMIPTPVFNGMRGEIVECESANPTQWKMKVALEDGNFYSGLVSKFLFHSETTKLPTGVYYKDAGDLADFGDTLTVHKAQGSEFNRVFIFGTAWGEWKHRWLYTAITRAKNELYICGDKF